MNKMNIVLYSTSSKRPCLILQTEDLTLSLFKLYLHQSTALSHLTTVEWKKWEKNLPPTSQWNLLIIQYILLKPWMSVIPSTIHFTKPAIQTASFKNKKQFTECCLLLAHERWTMQILSWTDIVRFFSPVLYY